ncbi:dentin sialophosphoprotein-like isoform X2 [Branchiostoma floridae]|uniref:Dentin sialophosphoprotein-like isoform X2 n=1 Tax=Branchiostoma floridae TaxID=7739 RepID=A0A9J7MSC7_BRAFL|nr:dentin sialophosphoprotein-like isoform X2 [Branchiostoma floridae]
MEKNKEGCQVAMLIDLGSPAMTGPVVTGKENITSTSSAKSTPSKSPPRKRSALQPVNGDRTEGMLTSPRVKRDILDTTDHVNRVEDSTKDEGGMVSDDSPNEAKQNEVNNDKIEDAVGLLETEEFDFDIPVSPVNKEQEGETSVNKEDNEEDDDEVFFGPVGFREQVISKAKDIQEEEEKFVPLELNGDQYAELFVEATRLAKELEKESKRNREEEIKLAKTEARLFKKKAPQNSPRNSPRRMTYTLDTPEKEGPSSSTTTADAQDSKQTQQNNEVKEGQSGLIPKRLGRPAVRNNTYTSNGSSRIGSGIRPPGSSSGSQKLSCSNNESGEKAATEKSADSSEKEANGRRELIKPGIRKGTFTMSPINTNSNNSHVTRNGSDSNGAADAPKQPVKRRSGIPAPGSRGSSLPRSQIPRKGSAGMNSSMNRSVSMESRMSRSASQNGQNDSTNPSLGSLGRSFSNGSIDDSDDAASVTSDASDISTASAPAAVKRKGSVGSLPQNAKVVKTSAMPQRSGSVPKLSGRRRSNSASSTSRTSSTPSKGPSKKRVPCLQPPQTKPQLAKPAASANTSFSKKSLLPGGGYGVPMPKKQQPMRATLPMSQISTPKVNGNSQVQSTPRTIPALTPRASIPSASTPVVQDKKVVPKRISVDEQPGSANRPLPAVPSTPQNSRIPSASSASSRRRSGIPTPRSMQRQSRLPPRGSALPTPGSSRRSCLPTLAANDSPSEFPATHLRKVQEINDSPLALRGSGPDNLPKALIDFGDEDMKSNSPAVANVSSLLYRCFLSCVVISGGYQYKKFRSRYGPGPEDGMQVRT